MKKLIALVAGLMLAVLGVVIPTSTARADESQAEQCLITPAKEVVTHHDAITHEEYRWKQDVPAVQEVSHTEYQFSRTNPGSDEVSHTEYQFSRTNPGHAETFTTEYKYKKVIPAVEGIKECQYKKWVNDTKTQYYYSKYTHTKTRTSAVDGFWQEFSPTEPGTFDGPPSWPSDSRGKWSAKKTSGGPDQGTQGVFQSGGGNGSWFYRQLDIPAGAWSDYGPWTQWTPISHDSWQDFNQPSIGDPAFHAQGSDNGTDWYREWQVRNTGETRQVANGGHWETKWAIKNPGDGWVKDTSVDCRWKVEPIPVQTVYYKDGAWTTDTPGDPWVQIDERTVSNSDYVAPFTEYRKADGSPSTNVSDAAWFKESAFDGWTQFNSKKVVDKDKVDPFTEYRKADGSPSTNVSDAAWFKESAFDGWTQFNSKKVVDKELVPGYTVYYVEGGEPTLVLGDSNWTTKDPGELWVFVDRRVVTDQEAYDTVKKTPAVYGDCTDVQQGPGAGGMHPLFYVGVSVLAALLFALVGWRFYRKSVAKG